MVWSCDSCILHNREYYVYIRSSWYAECLRRGNYCNVRITHYEFERLQEEHDNLIERIERNRAAVSAALEK